MFALFFYEFDLRFNIAKYNIKTINNELNLYLKTQICNLDLSNKKYRTSFKMTYQIRFLYQITKYKN